MELFARSSSRKPEAEVKPAQPNAAEEGEEEPGASDMERAVASAAAADARLRRAQASAPVVPAAPIPQASDWVGFTDQKLVVDTLTQAGKAAPPPGYRIYRQENRWYARHEGNWLAGSSKALSHFSNEEAIVAVYDRIMQHHDQMLTERVAAEAAKSAARAERALAARQRRSNPKPAPPPPVVPARGPRARRGAARGSHQGDGESSGRSSSPHSSEAPPVSPGSD